MSRKAIGNLGTDATLEEEFPANAAAQVQIWKYGLLLAETDNVDDISLALSLAGGGDEKAGSEIAELFEKDHPWHKAL